MKIKAVSFDVGGTLLEPWPSVGAVYGRAAMDLGLGSFPPDRITERFFSAWSARSQFGYSRSEWRGLVAEAFTGMCEVSDILFERIYDQFARADAWRIFDDVSPTLEMLRKRGVKLAVISNWDERLRPLLAEAGLETFFDVIVISIESAAHKPAPGIFEAASRALGLQPGSILHVGDSTREDVQGARQAGFHALKLCRKGAQSLDEIASLAEIPSRIIGMQSSPETQQR